MRQPTWAKFAVGARLWAIVFAANLTGACLVAALAVELRMVGINLLAAMRRFQAG